MSHSQAYRDGWKDYLYGEYIKPAVLADQADYDRGWCDSRDRAQAYAERNQNGYPDCAEVAPGVFIAAGDAVYIADDEGEVVTWNADEAAEDGEAFTAALFAVALAAASGPAAVRQNIKDQGQTLERLILEPTRNEALEALSGLFEHCVMIHKHWGENSNNREADAAKARARNVLARAGVQIEEAG